MEKGHKLERIDPRVLVEEARGRVMARGHFDTEPHDLNVLSARIEKEKLSLEVVREELDKILGSGIER